jgi:hypothetical protein
VARGRLGIEEALHLRREVEAAIHRGVQAAAARGPIPALQPGRAVTTIAGLARELKALETIVTRPAPAAEPSRPASRKRRTRRPPSSSQTRS